MPAYNNTPINRINRSMDEYRMNNTNKRFMIIIPAAPISGVLFFCCSLWVIRSHPFPSADSTLPRDEPT